jgi:hypothetical protein
MQKALRTLGIVLTLALLCVSSSANAKDSTKSKHYVLQGVGADCATLADPNFCYSGSETFTYSLEISIAGTNVSGTLIIFSREDTRGPYPLLEGKLWNNILSFTVIDQWSVIYNFSLLSLGDNKFEGGVVEMTPGGDPEQDCLHTGLTGLDMVQFWPVQ